MEGRLSCEILVGSLPFAGPPHVKPPAPAPYEGKVVRQHDQAERNHPETENRQEAKNTAENQHAANGDATKARLRQPHTPRADDEFMRAGIYAEFFGFPLFCHQILPVKCLACAIA